MNWAEFLSNGTFASTSSSNGHGAVVVHPNHPNATPPPPYPVTPPAFALILHRLCMDNAEFAGRLFIQHVLYEPTSAAIMLFRLSQSEDPLMRRTCMVLVEALSVNDPRAAARFLASFPTGGPY